MTKRSAVLALPEDVRGELERQLVARAFSDYRGLAAWLEDRGFEISKSALHRYGQEFEDRVEALRTATHQAKLIVESTPDDEGAVSEALMRLVQEKIFQLMMQLEINPAKSPNLGSLARAVAELGRASVTQKKWQAEVRERIETRLKKLDAETGAGRVDAETLRRVREEIYGVV